MTVLLVGRVHLQAAPWENKDVVLRTIGSIGNSVGTVGKGAESCNLQCLEARGGIRWW